MKHLMYEKWMFTFARYIFILIFSDELIWNKCDLMICLQNNAYYKYSTSYSLVKKSQ